MYASFDIFICKPYSCDFTTAHLECDVNFSLFKFLVSSGTVWSYCTFWYYSWVLLYYLTNF